MPPTLSPEFVTFKSRGKQQANAISDVFEHILEALFASEPSSHVSFVYPRRHVA